MGGTTLVISRSETGKVLLRQPLDSTKNQPHASSPTFNCFTRSGLDAWNASESITIVWTASASRRPTARRVTINSSKAYRDFQVNTHPSTQRHRRRSFTQHYTPHRKPNFLHIIQGQSLTLVLSFLWFFWARTLKKNKNTPESILNTSPQPEPQEYGLISMRMF